VVGDLWNWRYVENKGAAWGLLAGASDKLRVPFFILVSLGAIAFIISFFRKLPETQLLLIVSLSLVFGGAIGNFMDRLHLNYVIDFIDWHIGPSHWPTFNFADSAITTGVALLVIQWIRDWAAGRNKSAAEASARETAPGKTS
jgi:signal peptidase II